jgi:hypothetical protein
VKTEELVRIGKDYFTKVAVGGLKASLVTALPFLASPVPMYFLDAFLDWLIGMIADILEERAFFLYTDFRTSEQGKAYVEAKRRGFEAEMSGDPEAIKKSQQEIISKFRTFAKFAG